MHTHSPGPGPVRVLVRDVVADYSERSLPSALPPIGDPESVVCDVLDRVAGFGPLQRYLDDPEVPGDEEHLQHSE